jgi:hypothetical protein
MSSMDLLSVPLRNATPEELKAQGESLARNYKPGPRHAIMRPTLDDLQRENGDTVETVQQIYTRGYEAGYHAALLAVRAKTNVLLDGLSAKDETPKTHICKHCKNPGKPFYDGPVAYVHANDEDFSHCGRFFEGMDGL